MPNYTATEFLLKLAKLKKEELLELDGIGEVLANNITQFTESEKFEELLGKFLELENNNKGLTIKTKTDNQEGRLSDQTICITGKFDIPRSQIKSKLEELGAKVVGTITKNTTTLIAGKDSGSKLAKARELEIKIISDYKEL